MRTFCAVLLVSVLLLAPPDVRRSMIPPAADDQATVEDLGEAMNARDADGAVAMMTDKTYYADVNLPAPPRSVRHLFPLAEIL